MGPELDALIVRALLAAGFQVVSLGEGEARVRWTDGAEHELGFANLRRLLLGAEPDQRAAVASAFVARWKGQALRAGDALEMSLTTLVPKLRPPGEPGLGLAEPWSEPLAGGALRLSLAFDDPDALRLVPLLSVPRLGLPLADLKRLAMDNLAARSEGLRVELAVRSRPLAPFRVALEDGHDATRLLLATALVPEARGVLAVAPARDLLLCAPVPGEIPWSEARGVGAELREVARGAWARLPWPLSPELFWCVGGAVHLAPPSETWGIEAPE